MKKPVCPFNYRRKAVRELSRIHERVGLNELLGGVPPEEKEMEIEVVRVEVAKLAMSPGQILAVKCKSILSESQSEEIAKVMKSVGPEGVKVFVLDEEFDICVVEPPNA